jgi:hypothetical protein
MDNYVSTPGTFVPTTGSRFELTPARKTLLLMAGGAGIGAAQVFLVRKFTTGDTVKPWGTSLDFLGDFSKPSAVIGIAAGVAGIALGLFVVRDTKIQNVLVGYGGAALTSGVLSGLNMV